MEAMGRGLNVSIGPEHFHCRICHKPLRPPIFQTVSGYMLCETCGDRIAGNPDGQIFVLNLEQKAGQLAVSLACVRAGATESKYGCSLSFSCFEGRHGDATLSRIPCSTLSDGPPTGWFCFVPNAPSGGAV
ncbi:hypothetical protein EJB05_31826, partial [Eragrostis curvula]